MDCTLTLLFLTYFHSEQLSSQRIQPMRNTIISKPPSKEEMLFGELEIKLLGGVEEQSLRVGSSFPRHGGCGGSEASP